jgi:hypothetical protein
VGDVDAAPVAMADGERRARDRPLNAEGVTGSADQGCLAGAQLAGHGDHVAGIQLRGETGAHRLGFLRRGGFDVHVVEARRGPAEPWARP